MSEKVRVSTYVTPEVKEKIEIEAKKKGLSVSSFMRFLLIEEIKNK